MFETEKYQKQIARLCRKYEIERFEVFGSALRKEFSAGSDVDCLIDFVEDGGNYFERFFNFKRELEVLFERDVDLVVAKAIRNPYFKTSVERGKKLVYAA